MYAPFIARGNGLNVIGPVGQICGFCTNSRRLPFISRLLRPGGCPGGGGAQNEIEINAALGRIRYIRVNLGECKLSARGLDFAPDSVKGSPCPRVGSRKPVIPGKAEQIDTEEVPRNRSGWRVQSYCRKFPTTGARLPVLFRMPPTDQQRS